MNIEENKKIHDDKYLDDFEVFEVIKFIFTKKFLISIITVVFSISSILYALNIQNTYLSQTLLVPSDDSNSISSQIGSLSPLAGFAGINLAQGNASKSTEAIEKIQSLEFFTNSFLPYIKLENLMAVESWDIVSNKLVYKKEIFDVKNSTWIRKATFPQTQIPSDQEAFKIYKKILSINENKRTSFVSLSIEHQSPYIAKKWVSIIVNNINTTMQEIDKKEASNNIDFLYETISQVEIAEVKEAISEILESQMKSLMLTSASDNYVFKTVYSAFVPEEKFAPNRSLIVIIGTFFGLIFAVMLVVIIFFKKHR